MKTNPTPFQRLQMIHAVAPQSISKAKGTSLSICEEGDAAFVDILVASDGCLLVQYMWKDSGEYDHLEMTELTDDECSRIIDAIKAN